MLPQKSHSAALAGHSGPSAGLVGDGGACDLLGHGGGFELLLVGCVDGGLFLADELGFLNGEFFVRFNFDFFGFFHGFLLDECGHLLELGAHLWMVLAGMDLELAITGREACLVVRKSLGLRHLGGLCRSPTNSDNN